MGGMQTISPDQLEHITGGRARAASSSKLDDQIEQALTKLQSDIKDLARAPQSNNQMTTMMMMAMMARR